MKELFKSRAGRWILFASFCFIMACVSFPFDQALFHAFTIGFTFVGAIALMVALFVVLIFDLANLKLIIIANHDSNHELTKKVMKLEKKIKIMEGWQEFTEAALKQQNIKLEIIVSEIEDN